MRETAAGTPLLAAENLSLERGGRQLFSELSLSVMRGQLWQVAGDNGSGKTSLLRILAGLSRYGYGGTLQRSAELLYLGHQSAVKTLLTPRENLLWHPAGQCVSAERDVHEALARVGLYGFEHALCATLSAGQLRRVNLARLYLSAAPLWILDEPFTAIDRRGVTALEERMAEHTRQGGSVVLTSHQQLALQSEVHSVLLGGGGAA